MSTAGNLTPNRKAVMEGGNYTPIPNDLLANANISHSVARVFGIITLFDPSYPSIRRICRMGGMGKHTVQRAITWLTEHSILERTSSSSKLKTNQYNVLPRSKWKLPITSQDGLASTPVPQLGTACTHETENDVPPAGTGVTPLRVSNKSNTNKSNSKNIHKKLDYNNGSRQPAIRTMEESLPLHFIMEAKLAYCREFASRYGGQRYLNKYLKQLEDNTLQSEFVSQSIEFSKFGGTIYGRIKSEFDRLLSQKTRHTPQPKFLVTEASYSAYQMSLKSEISDFRWPHLILPFTGTSLISKSLDEDPEARLAFKTLNSFARHKTIESFERERWSNQPKDIVQIGPYIFNYYLIKSYLHFGVTSNFFNAILLKYERLIGSKLFRPDEQKTVIGLNLEPRSVWDKVYAPNLKVRPKSDEVLALQKKLHIPEQFIFTLSELNQRVQVNPKVRASDGGGMIKSRPVSGAVEVNHE